MAYVWPDSDVVAEGLEMLIVIFGMAVAEGGVKVRGSKVLEVAWKAS